MNKEELELKAKKIAKEVSDTPTELRGNLFLEIGIELEKNTQGFTSKLFKDIGKIYGFKKG